MKAATRLTCKSFIVALAVAAAADVVQHRPAVPTYCHAGRRCRGGRGQAKRCWADETCNVAPNPFDTPRAAHVRPAAAPGNPVAYRTHAERVAQRRREWKLRKTHKHAVAEKARAANATKGPFGSALVFKDGEEIKRRFGADAASSVGAIVDTVVLADAAYYVGYAGLSTFDRTLVDIRATRDQWDARLARPDNCTFTVGKNKQRGVADHQPNAPAGRVYMRHFRSLP